MWAKQIRPGMYYSSATQFCLLFAYNANSTMEFTLSWIFFSWKNSVLDFFLENLPASPIKYHGCSLTSKRSQSSQPRETRRSSLVGIETVYNYMLQADPISTPRPANSFVKIWSCKYFCGHSSFSTDLRRAVSS